LNGLSTVVNMYSVDGLVLSLMTNHYSFNVALRVDSETPSCDATSACV